MIQELGLNLFQWQRETLNLWCSRDKADKPAYVTCGLVVPRQNGKNAILEAYEFYMLAVCGMHILHTAHRVKTAKKAFQRLVKYFEQPNHPEIRALVEKIRRTNGEESIFLKNGGSIEFSARSRASNRGFDDIQIVVHDEAQELTDDQVNAINFTLSASSTGERQIIYTGTPPDETAPGEVFKRNRESAIFNDAKRTCWREWSVERIPPKGATFKEVIDDVYSANPSMGYVLDIGYTEIEFQQADLLGFAVERLGYWIPQSITTAALSASLWEAAEIDEIGNNYPWKTALAVKFSPDGSAYALAGCKLARPRRGERPQAAVELIEVGTTENGTKNLAQAIWERRGVVSSVVIDGVNGPSALCDNLAELKCPRGYVIRPRTSQVIDATQLLVDGLKDETLHHTGQNELNKSALGSVKRPIGARGGWGFGSTELADATPIEAISLAFWGARNTNRDPRRKQRML